MKEIRYTLLSDGSSDRALMPILTWLLRLHFTDWAIQPAWADLGRLPRPPKTLANKIATTLDLYPCTILFVHRDAEGESLQKRRDEIDQALQRIPRTTVPVVPVVPIRMQEAWMLAEEQAIRFAAGNPNGTAPLDLPKLSDIESIPDPKEVLHSLLKIASGLKGRRLRKFAVSATAFRVGEFIEDFSFLRALSAFSALESHLTQVKDRQNWM